MTRATRWSSDPSLSIHANTVDGVFYGTRTLLQLLRQDELVPAGTARDWPRYAERGLMMDLGRTHYPYEWLAERVRDMAYLKLNYLHLHFTDDEGWRIESDQQPPLHSEQFLSKDQIRSLVALAAQYHITVVPEIDMPGHMGAALAPHPEFWLRDRNGVADPGNIDFTIPEARAFLKSLIEEYLPLFPGPYWHMGADEFLPDSEYPNYPQLAAYAVLQYGPLATPKDATTGLINEMNELVKAHGKTMRVWNDVFSPGSVVLVDTDVVVEWWHDISGFFPNPTNPVPPRQLLLEGYSILNASFWPTYYYAPGGPGPAAPALEPMYENWAVHLFAGFIYNDQGPVVTLDVDPAEPGNRGAKVHVWGGDWTQGEPAEGLFPRLRVMAQKTWESPPLVATWPEFQSIIDRIASSPPDVDGDGVADLGDNCPFVANPGQEDSGGIATTEPDGVGNACQCGDVTGNGIVNGQDSNAIKRHGLALEPNPTFAVPGNCDVSGNGSCDGQDANAVTRVALGQSSPLFGQRCHNAIGAPVPPDL